MMILFKTLQIELLHLISSIIRIICSHISGVVTVFIIPFNVFHTLEENSHGKNKWLWESFILLHKGHKSCSGLHFIIQSWVGSLLLIANHKMKAHLGLQWENHTAFHHFALGSSSLKSFHISFVEKFTSSPLLDFHLTQSGLFWVREGTWICDNTRNWLYHSCGQFQLWPSIISATLH